MLRFVDMLAPLLYVKLMWDLWGPIKKVTFTFSCAYSFHDLAWFYINAVIDITYLLWVLLWYSSYVEPYLLCHVDQCFLCSLLGSWKVVNYIIAILFWKQTIWQHILKSEMNVHLVNEYKENLFKNKTVNKL